MLDFVPLLNSSLFAVLRLWHGTAAMFAVFKAVQYTYATYCGKNEWSFSPPGGYAGHLWEGAYQRNDGLPINPSWCGRDFKKLVMLALRLLDCFVPCVQFESKFSQHYLILICGCSIPSKYVIFVCNQHMSSVLNKGLLIVLKCHLYCSHFFTWR